MPDRIDELAAKASYGLRYASKVSEADAALSELVTLAKALRAEHDGWKVVQAEAAKDDDFGALLQAEHEHGLLHDHAEEVRRDTDE